MPCRGALQRCSGFPFSASISGKRRPTIASLTLTIQASTDDAVSDGGSDVYQDSATTLNWGSSGGTTGNYGQGIRVLNVTLSGSDTINSAYVSLMKSGAVWNNNIWRLTAIDADNTPTFSSSDRPGARAIVSASIAAGSADENRADGTRYEFPRSGDTAQRTTLGAAVAAVLGRGGWSSGNALAIVNNSKQDASADTGFARTNFHSWDSSTTDSEPQLVIDYTAGVSGQTITAVAIASGHSLHTATLTAVRSIAAAAIPSGHVLHAGTVSVETAQQIDAAAIPSGHQLHAATVTGTYSIAAAAIASGHALHTATLTAERDIAAATIASGHALHNAAIAETVAAPTNLVATAISQSQIDVSWTSNASVATHTVVERSPDGSTGWVVLTSILSPTAQAYSDTGLDASTTWFYRAKDRRL